MKLNELQRYMPLAFSWQEKLQASSENETYLRAELKRVEAALRSLREDARLVQQDKAKKLQESLALQEALPQLVAAGQIKPQQANDQNRKLNEIIAELQADLRGYNQLLQAQTAEEAGGFIDLPLDEYPKALHTANAVPHPFLFWRRLEAEDRRTILVTLFVLIIGVSSLFYFLRWRDQVVFSAWVEEASETRILFLESHSNEPFPVFLLMPWHEAEELEVGAESKTFQIELQLRFSLQEPFRSLPATDQPWQLSGQYLQYAGPVRVLPHLSEAINLDLNVIRELYPEAIGLRVRIRNQRGNIAFTETIMWHGN